MIETLEQYHEQGLLRKQTHPNHDLTIWNYSTKVQYERLWDDITVQCRGLVTNGSGAIVARPFHKFFNYEELTPEQIPDEYFDVYEKMDGSLGILFNYKGEWVLATRGSFTSDQSVKGTELLQKYDYNKLHPDYTYLFEIIYPENRIVCQYDYEDLVLLGMIHTETGYEVSIHSGDDKDIRFKNMLNNIGLNIVKKYDGLRDYTFLKRMVGDNKEGFVVRFSNGSRMKIKGEEYLRLHKIMTNISTTSVWEILSTDGDLSILLDNVPDEFYKKIKEFERNLRYAHYNLSEYCGKFHDHFRYGKYGDREVEPTKKELSEHLRVNVKPELHSIVYSMCDGKAYDHIIWRLIKPEFRKL